MNVAVIDAAQPAAAKSADRMPRPGAQWADEVTGQEDAAPTSAGGFAALLAGLSTAPSAVDETASEAAEAEASVSIEGAPLPAVEGSVASNGFAGSALSFVPDGLPAATPLPEGNTVPPGGEMPLALDGQETPVGTQEAPETLDGRLISKPLAFVEIADDPGPEMYPVDPPSAEGSDGQPRILEAAVISEEDLGTEPPPTGQAVPAAPTAPNAGAQAQGTEPARPPLGDGGPGFGDRGNDTGLQTPAPETRYPTPVFSSPASDVSATEAGDTASTPTASPAEARQVVGPSDESHNADSDEKALPSGEAQPTEPIQPTAAGGSIERVEARASEPGRAEPQGTGASSDTEPAGTGAPGVSEPDVPPAAARDAASNANRPGPDGLARQDQAVPSAQEPVEAEALHGSEARPPLVGREPGAGDRANETDFQTPTPETRYPTPVLSSPAAGPARGAGTVDPDLPAAQHAGTTTGQSQSVESRAVEPGTGLGQAVLQESDAPEETPSAVPPTEDQSRKSVGRLVRAAQLMVRTNGGTARVVLEPPSLGTVRLDIRVQDRVVSAALCTQTRQACDLVTNHLPALRQALERQGLTVGQLDVASEEQSTNDPASGEGGPQWSVDRWPRSAGGGSAPQEPETGQTPAEDEAPEYVVGPLKPVLAAGRAILDVLA